MPLALSLLTWRECVVGMKPVESAQLEIRRTWDIRPKATPNLNGGNVANGPVRVDALGAGVNSETLGYVRWRMSDSVLFSKPCRRLLTEGYDQKAQILMVEEVWVTPAGDLLRQREERTSSRGKDIAEAVFWPDHIELTRIDVRKQSTFMEVNPAGGMEEVQKRFKPMDGKKKSFLQLDALAGTFHKVEVEKSGRFRGDWGGEKYEGDAYRFTVDGQTQTLMMTPEEETVQVQFNSEVSLVLNGPTKSRRKEGLFAFQPSRRRLIGRRANAVGSLGA